jgi:hypothetical protein
MRQEIASGPWEVELIAGLASCGEISISFKRCAESGLSLCFVNGGDCSLERQCAIAGEAAAAIRARLAHGDAFRC